MIRINCDLCGKREQELVKALIEDVELNVCHPCSKFGKVLTTTKKSIKVTMEKAKLPDKEETIRLLADDYAETIKKKRESLNLTQLDFAKKINEKESTIHKIETKSLEPSLEIAQKLKNKFGINIIEEHVEKHQTFKRNERGRLTIGDFIKFKN